MTSNEIAQVVRLRLAAELEDESRSLAKLATEIALLSTTTDSSHSEWMRTLALMFEIERYYTALESTFMRILKSLDGDVPSGHGWHQSLLRAVTIQVPGIRPAVIRLELFDDLKEVLRFRHLARHGYDVEPELQRVAEQATRVINIQQELATSLERFIEWLKQESFTQ